MEEVILEKELEYHSSSGEIAKASVKIYPSRLVIEKKGELESILIPYINVLNLRRDPKWGYLAGGIVTIFIAAVLYLIPPVKNTFILESPFKEVIPVFLLFFAVALIISWWYYRCFILTVNSFGHIARLSDRKEAPLKELYNQLENLRIRST